MELLPGMSLEELVDRYGPLPPGRVVFLLGQICGALQEAHAVGLIHRDIKPANIFVAQRGGIFDVAKLLDFGLVKERSAQVASTDSAKYGSFSGTPLYMSPEQASAYEDVDGRADIYSLGAVAYFLLTGKPPFEGKNVVQLLAAHAGSEVPPPSSTGVDVPTDLEQVILQCLAKKPEARFVEAVSFGKALAACQCAADWSAESAKNWWEQHQQGAESSWESKPKPIDATIAVTLDETAQREHGDRVK
jgi:serine/threonine-protein kinase